MTSEFTFEALQFLCKQVKETITNRVRSFYTEQHVTVALASPIELESQLRSLITAFRTITTNDFGLSSRVIRDTIQSNLIVSHLGTNAEFLVLSYYNGTPARPKSYGSCSCARNALCKTQLDVHDNAGDIALFSVPGMFTGCYVLQSLLQSSLECFYDQMCFDQLKVALSRNFSSNATILNAKAPSVYLKNTTVGDIVDELMIEAWNWTVLYDKYYEACQPSECRYTVKTRNAAIYIVTTLIGLVGGLVTALKIVVPRVIGLHSYFRRRRQVIATNTAAKNENEQPVAPISTVSL